MSRGRTCLGLPRVILTYDSSWSPAFGVPFEAALKGLPEEQQLELGCVLREGRSKQGTSSEAQSAWICSSRALARGVSASTPSGAPI
jgi:hypothetical protein